MILCSEIFYMNSDWFQVGKHGVFWYVFQLKGLGIYLMIFYLHFEVNFGVSSNNIRVCRSNISLSKLQKNYIYLDVCVCVCVITKKCRTKPFWRFVDNSRLVQRVITHWSAPPKPSANDMLGNTSPPHSEPRVCLRLILFISIILN